MSQQSIFTSGAPKPIGPYSPAVHWENLVFLSGQGPLDPATGKSVGGDIVNQTRQTLKNMDAILKAAGSSKSQVLKTTVYLTDMNDFSAMNAIYAEYFQGVTFPARTTIQAAALPAGINVEIEAIAYREPNAS